MGATSRVAPNLTLNWPLGAAKYSMRMTEAERRFHLQMAAQSFNKTWDYLEMKRRTAKDEEMMLHLAHVSRYHWSLVGKPRNQAVGDWQTSRVYAALREPALSLQFAKSSLEIAKKNKLSDVSSNAHEAMARAHAIAGNKKLARDHLNAARETLESLEIDNEDRKIYLGQILETEKMINKHSSKL
jgi:hypothetical protein